MDLLVKIKPLNKSDPFCMKGRHFINPKTIWLAQFLIMLLVIQQVYGANPSECFHSVPELIKYIWVQWYLRSRSVSRAEN